MASCSIRNHEVIPLSHFYAYIAASDLKAPRRFPTFETGHEELILCEAIATSARERRWVPVNYK